MKTEPPASPPTISADRLATVLGSDPIPEGYVRFNGYLQPCKGGGTHRIVIDDQFLRWLEVRTEDIVCRVDGAGDPHDRRDQIWVKRSARMVQCTVSCAPDIANDGWGVDTSRVRSRARLDSDNDVCGDSDGPPPPY